MSNWNGVLAPLGIVVSKSGRSEATSSKWAEKASGNEPGTGGLAFGVNTKDKGLPRVMSASNSLKRAESEMVIAPGNVPATLPTLKDTPKAHR